MREQGFGLRGKIGEGQEAISAGGSGEFGEESQGPRGQRIRNCPKSPYRPQLEALRVRWTGQKHYVLAVVDSQLYR